MERLNNNKSLHKQWDVLSSSIVEDSWKQELLQYVLKLWLTIRSHSYAKLIMEHFKSSEKQQRIMEVVKKCFFLEIIPI